jgi:hypothetical protein
MSNLEPNRTLLRGFIRISPPSKFTTPVSVEVVFGAPGKHCHGAGICKVLPVEHVRVHWKCPNARAWLNATPEGVLSLTFDRNSLSPELTKRYFAGDVFLVEEAYMIPNTLLSMLNIGSFTIEPGAYSVEVSEFFLVVTF